MENFKENNRDEKLLSKNSEFVAKITNLGMNGEGVSRVNNQVVFIPFALPNEVVEGVVINDKKNFLIGKITDIVESSKDRTNAPCPYYKKCGGCNLQHLKYEKQLQFKTDLVKQTLLKVGEIDFNPQPCISSDLCYGYRNKASFPVLQINEKAQIGMFRTASHNLVEVDNCLLQKQLVNKLIKVTKKWLEDFKIEAYNEQTKNGLVKHLVARELGNSILITLVCTSFNVPYLDEYVKLLKQNFSDFGLNLNLNTLNNNVILGNEYKHIYGNEKLNVCSFNINHNVSSASFYQVNNFIKDKIYSFVLDNINKDSTVIDAYSGAGLLSAIIATKAKFVYGVEIVKQATDNANELVSLNKINNLKNINGDCSKVLPKLVKQISGESIVVLDPPRKGCDKMVLESLLQSKPNKIIYIACSIVSLSRDLKILLGGGEYTLKNIVPYDMFPQTSNVETVAVLEKI